MFVLRKKFAHLMPMAWCFEWIELKGKWVKLNAFEHNVCNWFFLRLEQDNAWDFFSRWIDSLHWWKINYKASLKSLTIHFKSWSFLFLFYFYYTRHVRLQLPIIQAVVALWCSYAWLSWYYTASCSFVYHFFINSYALKEKIRVLFEREKMT